jgi:hypothetical protein
MFLDQLSELVLILSYDKGHAIVLIVSQRIELLGLSLTGRKKKQQPYCTVGDTLTGLFATSLLDTDQLTFESSIRCLRCVLSLAK